MADASRKQQTKRQTHNEDRHISKMIVHAVEAETNARGENRYNVVSNGKNTKN